jgi:putative phosphoesterase
VARLNTADLIVHAGDVSTATTLAQIELIGPPVLAVRGNVDDDELACRLPPERIIEANGARIAIIHDAGPRNRRLTRMRRRFPAADAVVFGHSHQPLHESEGGFQIFNPGSPTERRRAPAHTMGLARAAGGAVEFELLELP